MNDKHHPFIGVDSQDDRLAKVLDLYKIDFYTKDSIIP